MTGGRPVRLSAPGHSPRPLARFPAVELATGTQLWRCHRADRGPWWFSSDGSGRFDLPIPDGTCYLADDPLVAFVEVVSQGSVDGLTVSPTFCAQRRVTPNPRALPIARVGHAGPGGQGQTAHPAPLTQPGARREPGADLVPQAGAVQGPA